MELSPSIAFTLILVSVLLTMAAIKIMRLPTLPAYFIAGIFLGPNGLGVLHSNEAVHIVGELGIILLLFTIGLKFNIQTLYSIRRYVLLLGNMQVVATTVVISAVAWFWVDNILIATLIGFIATMSSTAIVSQLLLENNLVTSPIGRRAIAVLLLQDIIVIPLIIIYSNEGGEHSLLITSLLLIGKIIVVMLFVMLIAPKIMHIWLNWAARHSDKELFIVNIVTILALFPMLTGILGLSYALGGFLAGILIAETFHRHRVEQTVEPFRHLFLGFFFITLGILIEPAALADNALMILLLTLAVLVIKFPIAYIGMKLVGTHKAASYGAAFMLAGTGEFGFVLLAVAKSSGIVSDELFQLLAPVNMLAMIVVPIFWQQVHRFISRLSDNDTIANAQQTKENLAKAQHLNNHTIIAGFGRTGQSVVGVFRSLDIQDFIVLEEDYVLMESAGNAEHIVYGSSDQHSALLSAGILRARALIVSYTEPSCAALTIQRTRELNASVFIVAKAINNNQAKIFYNAGADEVLVEAHETGFSLAERILRKQNINNTLLLQQVMENARSGQNRLFAGEFTGTQNDEETDSQKLFTGVQVERQEALALADMPPEIEIISWRRNDIELNIKSEKTINYGDKLILLGNDKATQQAKKMLSD